MWSPFNSRLMVTYTQPEVMKLIVGTHASTHVLRDAADDTFTARHAACPVAVLLAASHLRVNH